MNLIKKLSLLTALVAVMFAFNACEEDTVAPVEDTPSAPIDLQATSINDNTVHIKWKDASDIDMSQLKDYTITYYPSNTSSTNAPEMSASQSGVAVEIAGLDKDKEYTFEVVTNYDNGNSSTAAKIKWAPAMRFIQVDANTIKLYASDVSNKGSGLALYEDDGLGEFFPTVKTIAQIAEWNLGLDTKDSKVKFGSASKLNYAGASTAVESASVSDAVPAASLNDVFDSQALDNKNYSQDVHDLTNATSSVVVYVKNTKANGDVHYAKVFLKNVNGSFLQGATGDKYVEIQVSYQANAGFPYAKK
jgi:fibronectin type III domain protein